MKPRKSLEIIDIIGDVVKATSEDCRIIPYNCDGVQTEISCPPINYIFGNPTYWKDRLDEMSKTPTGNEMKMPLIALNCPFTEDRTDPKYYTQSKVWLIIACSTLQQWSNEQRRLYSFGNVLTPIYDKFIETLREDRRLDFGYRPLVRHLKSENYSFGRYGAVTPSGDEVSEPIDAIIISNLEIKVKSPNCR